jgi:peptidoglycan-N-acetylglucosamine deacetylase
MNWNGHKAAISLTFDDGLPCQLKHAIPAMDRAGIKGTFFLASNCPDYPYNAAAWRLAGRSGHEIGSHSVTHSKAASLSEDQCYLEAFHSRNSLERATGQRVTSFCYPYTDAPKQLQDQVKRFYWQARGGRGAREDKNIVPGDGLNLFNVPCYHVSWKSFLPSEQPEDYLYPKIQEAIERGAWIVLMFHGIGQEGTWDNVPLTAFEGLLQHLTEHAKLGQLWVAPFGTLAQYLRGKQ